MLTGWDVYLITRLDFFRDFFTLIIVAAIVILIFEGMIFTLEYDGDKKAAPRLWQAIKTGLVILPILAFVRTITPSTKDAIAIYLLPKIANNEQVQKLPENTLKFLNQKLEKWIEDLGPKKKE